MISAIISFLAGIIISFISNTGYYGIFVLMTLESMLIPIPSEVTMPFAGFLSYSGVLNFWLVVLIGALANLAGSIIAYYIGYVWEEKLIKNSIKRYGKFLLVSESEFDKASSWFNKYGSSIVFFSRLLPIVRTYISLPAGIAKMKFLKFCTLTFFGSLLWSFFLAYIGFTFGQNWGAIEPIYRKFEYGIVIAVIILIVFYIIHKIRKKKS